MSAQPAADTAPPARAATTPPANPVDRVLGDLHARIRREPAAGAVADYIPEL